MQRRRLSALVLGVSALCLTDCREGATKTFVKDAAVAAALVAPQKIGAAKIFFFGHSLVDQDMPAMLGTLAAARGKRYAAHGQLGWGTPLSAHDEWDGNFDAHAPLGFVDENRGRTFFAGEGKAQLEKGGYDVLVLTESNGHTLGNGNETVEHATHLIALARKKNPAIRVFLYTVWLDRKLFPSEDAWRAKTETDIKWWESVADRINAQIDGPDIFVIPGGPLLARVTREVAQGKLPGLAVNDLFNKDDGVHVSDRGFYVIALAHYVAIFRDTAVGLPNQTMTEDGPAEPLSAEHAARVQQLVMDYLEGYPRSGV